MLVQVLCRASAAALELCAVPALSPFPLCPSWCWNLLLSPGEIPPVPWLPLNCRKCTNTLLMTSLSPCLAVVTSKGCAIIQVPCGICFLHTAAPCCCCCCSSHGAQSAATVLADYWILCLKKLSAVLADGCLACEFHTLRVGQFNILLHC